MRRTVAWWAGLFALAACLSLLLVMLRSDGGLSTAANVAQLVSIPLAAIPLVVALWLWRRKTPTAVTSARVAEAIDALAVAVKNQWQTEAALRSRHGAPMPIHWRVTTREGVQAHPDTISKRPLLLLDAASHDLDGFVADFRALKAKRVVLLGGPGAGKTTLAVQLLLKLIEVRAANEPIPVLVSAASWDVTQQPDLRTWLADRLVAEYPMLRSQDLGAGAARALVDGGHVLPVLDGLDELPQAAQVAMIAALNEPSGPLILTCRTTEFTTAITGARQLLSSALVMEPEPMDGPTIANHLDRCRPPGAHPAWDQVLGSLRTETSPLSEIATTALGLWLVREIYLQPRTAPDGSPIPFPDPLPLTDRNTFATAAALLDHLLDDFVPAVIASRPPLRETAESEPFRPRKRHDPAQMEAWLGRLAILIGQGTSDDPRDFVWWRLAHMTRIWPRKRILLIGPGLFVLMLALWTLGDPPADLATFWEKRSWTAAFIAAAAGLSWGILHYWPGETPARANLQIRDWTPSIARVLARLVLAVIIGAVSIAAAIMVIIGLFLDDESWPKIAAITGLSYGFLLAAFDLFTAQLSEPARADLANTPLRSWTADRNLQSVRVGLLGSLCVLIPGIMITASFGFNLGLLMTALHIGLFGILAVGLGGRHHAWLAYVIAIRRLSRKGELPRDLMYFLDDCHRLGLLRAVGPIYQFRHAALQDRLAEKYSAQARSQS